MRRISSRWTFFYKRIFPLVWFSFMGFAVLAVIYSILAGKLVEPLPALLIPVGMLIFGYFLFKKLVFDLVDEVWDVGDALIVKNAGREERIALSDVMNTSYAIFVNPPRVALTLRGTGGRVIAFCAPIPFPPFGKSPVITELIARVDLERRRHAATTPLS